MAYSCQLLVQLICFKIGKWPLNVVYSVTANEISSYSHGTAVVYILFEYSIFCTQLMMSVVIDIKLQMFMFFIFLLFPITKLMLYKPQSCLYSLYFLFPHFSCEKIYNPTFGPNCQILTPPKIFFIVYMSPNYTNCSNMSMECFIFLNL